MRPSTVRHAARFVAPFLTSAAVALTTIDARAEVKPPPLPPLPPPPPVSLPTLPQVPPLPPPPKAPVLPAAPPSPRPPAAVSTPSVPVHLPGQQPTAPSAGSGGSHAGSTSGSLGSSGGAAHAGGTATRRTSGRPREPRVLRLSASRAWLTRTGPQARRRIFLRFVLARSTVVEFTVIRIAPDCRRVGRFRVAGRAGENRIPFRGRIRGRVLAPGTYRIRARALPGGRTLTETRLVIFRRTPARDELAAARSSNTCRAEVAGADGAGTPVSVATGGTSARPGGHDERRAHAGPVALGSDNRSRGRVLGTGVLGVQFGRAADAVKQIHPLLFVLLGIAIALLALAATPARLVPSVRVAAVLAYRRNAVAVAGAAALITVTVAHTLL